MSYELRHTQYTPFGTKICMSNKTFHNLISSLNFCALKLLQRSKYDTTHSKLRVVVVVVVVVALELEGRFQEDAGDVDAGRENAE